MFPSHHHPVRSFVLLAAPHRDPTRDGAAMPYLLHIFTDLITPAPGVSMDDAVLAILAGAHELDRDSSWNPDLLVQGTKRSLDTHPHPMVAIQPGAVCGLRMAPDQVPGYATPCVMTKDVVIFGEHRFERLTFFPHPFDTDTQGRIRRDIVRCLQELPRIVAILLGATQGYVESRGSLDLEDTFAVILRVAGSVAGFPNAPEAHVSSSLSRRFARNMLDGWIVRHTTPKQAGSMVATDEFHALIDQVGRKELVDVGRKAQQALACIDLPRTDILGKKAPSSAHARMASERELCDAAGESGDDADGLGLERRIARAMAMPASPVDMGFEIHQPMFPTTAHARMASLQRAEDVYARVAAVVA